MTWEDTIDKITLTNHGKTISNFLDWTIDHTYNTFSTIKTTIIPPQPKHLQPIQLERCKQCLETDLRHRKKGQQGLCNFLTNWEAKKMLRIINKKHYSKTETELIKKLVNTLDQTGNQLITPPKHRRKTT